MLYVTRFNPSQNLITTVAPSKTSSLPSVPRSTTTTAAPNSVTSSSMSPMEEATEIFMHELLSANGDKEKMEDQVVSQAFYRVVQQVVHYVLRPAFS